MHEYYVYIWKKKIANTSGSCCTTCLHNLLKKKNTTCIHRRTWNRNNPYFSENNQTALLTNPQSGVKKLEGKWLAKKLKPSYPPFYVHPCILRSCLQEAQMR